MNLQTKCAEIQAKAYWGCLHIGTVAFLFGPRRAYAHRLEICTPHHWLRFSKGKP